MNFIKEFKIKTENFSSREKFLLKKLTLAVKLIAPLYAKQKNEKYPGANFYPFDANKEEIEKAAEKNPLILDPYTFVERDKSGKLITIPFHIKFQKELKEIANVLREAAKISEDKVFALYLQSRAKALISDNYDQSNILWLKTAKSKIGFVIGPFDRYLDKLFFRKRAYMSWLGILDKKRTAEIERLKDMVLVTKKETLPEAQKVIIPKIISRVEDSIIFSGLIADFGFMFTGNNLPSSADLHIIKKYGSIFTIFKPSLKLRFQKRIYPIFKKIFEKKILKKYSRQALYKICLYQTSLHEISHSLMRYQDATERLKDLFPIFDELYADILRIKYLGFLSLKGIISHKELETGLIVFISQFFARWIDWLEKHIIIHYTTGAIIALNFFLEKKVINIKNKFIWIDFNKVFICNDELSELLEHYLALGNYKEAKGFINRYSSFKIFEKLLPRGVILKEEK